MANSNRFYKIVPPGEVYPLAFAPGDELPAWAVEQATADGAVAAGTAVPPTSVPAATAVAAPVMPGPARLIAKTTRKAEIHIDGKLTKFAKGVTVYDVVARLLIDDGAALEIRAAEGAPEST